MTAAQFEGLQVDEAAEVLAWRFDALCRSGYDLDAAAVLAANVEVDLHDAVDLVRRGCPPGARCQDPPLALSPKTAASGSTAAIPTSRHP